MTKYLSKANMTKVMRIIDFHCKVTNSSTYEYNVARLRASSRDEQTSAVPVDQSNHCDAGE